VTTNPPPGWLVTGNATQARYGASSIFPGASSEYGSQFLAGGPGSAVSTATQQFVATEHDTQLYIDIDYVSFELRAWLGGTSSQGDEATVELQCKDGLGNLLKSQVLGPVTAAERNGETVLLLRQTSGRVPAGTRHIDCIVTMTRLDGSYNNAFADDLILYFIIPDAVAPTSWSGIKSLYRETR
jgi:hypothetical protein